MISRTCSPFLTRMGLAENSYFFAVIWISCAGVAPGAGLCVAWTFSNARAGRTKTANINKGNLLAIILRLQLPAVYQACAFGAAAYFRSMCCRVKVRVPQ